MIRDEETIGKMDFYLCSSIANDSERIYNMVNYLSTNLFGRLKKRNSIINIHMSYCTQRILIKRKKCTDVILGYGEFHNYPMIGALPRDSWQHWLQHHFCLPLSIGSSNVLFFNYFIYNKHYGEELLMTMLSEVFLRETELRYIIVLQMPKDKMSEEQRQLTYDLPWAYAKTYYPKCYNVNTCKNVQLLHIFRREEILVPYRYRLGLAEDNDDIVDLVDVDRPDIREKFGDYYIAEEILENTVDANTFIISELDNMTCGFIGLNPHVDIIKIAKNFYCETLGNLVKCSSQLPQRQIVVSVTLALARPRAWLFSKSAMEDEIQRNTMNKELGPQSSLLTLQTHQNFRVLSDGSLSTIHERFYDIYHYMRVLALISSRLHSLDYYVEIQRKHLQIDYNISSDLLEVYDSSNVFALQLFGLAETQDVRRIVEFLAAAFSAFPDRDFCIFSMHPDAKMTKSIFEILKYFKVLSPRPTCTMPDQVYVTHRSLIYGEISCHRVLAEDRKHIEHIICVSGDQSRRNTDQSILPDPLFEGPRKEETVVFQILNRVLRDPFSGYHFLTIRCGNAAKPAQENAFVGFVIIRAVRKRWQLQRNYILPADKGTFSGEILVLRFHPLYHYHTDVVFREMARLTGFRDFYYISPTYSPIIPLPNDVDINMQPIEPRRIKKSDEVLRSLGYTTQTSRRRSVADPLYDERTTFQVYYHNLRPSKFIGNNNQIVIIGFSNLTKAFIRQLIFSWNTNDMRHSKLFCCLPRLHIHVIAQPGVVEAEFDRHFICPKCSTQSDCWVNQENTNDFIYDSVRRMDIRKYVKFISQDIKQINRETHHVILQNDCQLYYDKLLIMEDRRHGPPKPTRAPYELPSNYAHFNTRLQRIEFYHKLDILMDEPTPPQLIIYGLNLQVFEFINFLLDHRVPAACITLVTPYHLADVMNQKIYNNPYKDIAIQQILQEMVTDLGVTIYENYNFDHWTLFSQDMSTIDSVTFTSAAHPDEKLTLVCSFFVSCREKHIRSRYLDIFSKANIDYDRETNRVHVNETFQTSDPDIYAVGKFIKFTNDTNHQYEYVNNEDVTDKLLQILDLKYEPKVDPTTFDPKFSRPTFFQASLPMKHYLGKVCIPKRYVANHLSNEYRFSMTTYKNGSFTRVRLNEHRIVEEILCVTQTKMSFDFLQNMCGKHEAHLNNLMVGWYTGQVDNIIGFLQEPWSELIIHDAYAELHEYVQSIILPSATSIMDEVPERRSRKDVLEMIAERTGLTRSAQQGALDFLKKYNKDFSRIFHQQDAEKMSL